MRTSGRERRPIGASAAGLVAVAAMSIAGACGSDGRSSATAPGSADGSVPGSTVSVAGPSAPTTTAVPPPRPTPGHPVRVETVGHVVGAAGMPLEICEVISFSSPSACEHPIGLEAEDADVPGLAAVAPGAAIGTPSPPSSTTPAPGSFPRATADRVHVIGDFDGATLTPTEPITPWDASTRPVDPTPSDIPCPEPDGGWGSFGAHHPFPGSGAGAPSGDVQGLVTGEPDFAGLWMGGAVRTETGWDTSLQVPVVAFTADLERHEADIRTIYDGPLCVTSARFTAGELTATANAISQDGAGMAAAGITFLGGGATQSRNVVSVHVLLADQETVAWFTAQHPAGMIEVWGWLQPIAAS